MAACSRTLTSLSAVLWLTAAQASAGEVVDLPGAITALVQSIEQRRAETCPDDLESCPDEKSARRAGKLLLGAQKAFLKAAGLVAIGKDATAIGKSSGGVRKLDKAEPYVGLSVRNGVDTFVGIAISTTRSAQTSVALGLAQICDAFAAKLERSRGKADASLETAIDLANEGQSALALKHLGKAFKQYEKLVTKVDKLAAKPCPALRCGSDCVIANSSFIPGGDSCLELSPVPAGARLCYDTFLDVSYLQPGLQVDGPICHDFAPDGAILVDGRLDVNFPGLEPLDVSGSMAVTSCAGPDGFVRASEVDQSVLLESDLGRERINATVRSCPATLTLLGALLPVPPDALRACEGDVLIEEDVSVDVSVSGAGSDHARASSRHEVVGIEEITVGAETYTAARIDSQVHAVVGSGEGAEEVEYTVSTWLAPDVGQVRVVVREDGRRVIELELIDVTLP